MRTRRLRVLSLLALCSFLIGCDASELDAATTRCDQQCADYVMGVHQQWDTAYANYLAGVWFGSLIASSPASVCVKNHESATSGLYVAENPVSTASGAHQFIDSTWSTVALGRSRPDLVGHASAFVWWEQELSFQWAWDRWGAAPWAGHCD